MNIMNSVENFIVNRSYGASSAAYTVTGTYTVGTIGTSTSISFTGNGTVTFSSTK